jgi:hypothetical protein
LVVQAQENGDPIPSGEVAYELWNTMPMGLLRVQVGEV